MAGGFDWFIFNYTFFIYLFYFWKTRGKQGSLLFSQNRMNVFKL